MGIVKKLDQGSYRFPPGLLVSRFIFILYLSFIAIFLQGMRIDLPLVESLIQYFLLFSSLIGAVFAIENVSNAKLIFLKKDSEIKNNSQSHLILSRFILFFSFFVLVWMVKSGLDFTKIEIEFSKTEFFGIPSGYLVAIIPLVLTVMAWRTLILFVLSFKEQMSINSIKIPLLLMLGLLSLLYFSLLCSLVIITYGPTVSLFWFKY